MTQDGVRQDDQAYFDDLVTAASAGLVGDEVLLANISGERTDFIRLNNNEVRQAGSVPLYPTSETPEPAEGRTFVKVTGNPGPSKDRDTNPIYVDFWKQIASSDKP